MWQAARFLVLAVRELVVAASFLLAVGVAVWWVRSYSVGEAFIWNQTRPDRNPSLVFRSVNVWSAQGGVGVYVDEIGESPAPYGEPSETSTSFYWATDRMKMYPYVPIHRLQQGWSIQALGITLFESRNEYLVPGFQLTRSRAAVVPYWALLLPFLPLPVWRLMKWRRSRRTRYRRRNGLCLSCGYDLRGTPDRCPECGTAIGPQGTTAQAWSITASSPN